MNAIAPVDPNAHDRFVLRQRIRLVINQYEFSLPEDGDKPGEPFCFVEQKRFKFKEDIRFYTDESKTTELFRIKARQRFDPRARYDVTAADGTKIGEIQKVFGKSLLRSTYQLFDGSGAEVAVARERNRFVALFRRLVGLVPYIGDYADWLPIAYHFDFLRGEEKLGSHDRQLFKLRDVYTIDMSGDPQHTIDRRLILANAVGMDALQAR
ncbi:MAG: hypothetical protein QOF65_1803 [Thermoleophilaceae bacterium]|jgi:uncharacterized protein YxjI|nr:hypothetical protein [Thermoleophilaceae bacterium]